VIGYLVISDWFFYELPITAAIYFLF